MAYREDPEALATPRRGAHLPLLDRVTIASPCSVPWASMVGDARVRHCGVCDQQVFDTLAMTTAEVEALLAQANDRRICARLYRRPDGTLVAGDCADARAARRGNARRLVALGAVAAAAIGAIAWPRHGAPRGPASVVVYRGAFYDRSTSSDARPCVGTCGVLPATPAAPEPSMVDPALTTGWPGAPPAVAVPSQIDDRALHAAILGGADRTRR